MASPAKARKVEDCTVEGYLHSVSPAKNSKKNNKYFTAVIQLYDIRVFRSVSFSLDKLTAFSQASKNGTAVKLKNVHRSLSFSDPDGFDVICSKTTTLDVVTVPFSCIAPSGSTRTDVAAMKALGPRQNVDELEGKVLPRAAVSKIVLVNQEECELKEIWVGDTTGEMKLTLWDSLISQVHISKSFSNLATREMQGDIRLTTTPSTQVVEIIALDVPDGGTDDPDNGASSTTLRGLVSGVQIRARHRCPRCHSVQNDISANSITHRCDVCNLLQRSSVYRSTYGGTIVLTVDQRDHSLIVTDSCLTAYLARYRVVYSPNDVETIEEHFLNRPELEMCINNDSLITTIIQPPSQNRGDQGLVAANDGNTAKDGEAGQVVEDWEVIEAAEAGETAGLNQDVQRGSLVDELATEVE